MLLSAPEDARRQGAPMAVEEKVTPNSKQTALVTARARRRALDADRVARDRRIQAATAEVLVLLDQRSEAQRALQHLETAIGSALYRLLDQTRTGPRDGRAALRPAPRDDPPADPRRRRFCRRRPAPTRGNHVGRRSSPVAPRRTPA